MVETLTAISTIIIVTYYSIIVIIAPLDMCISNEFIKRKLDIFLYLLFPYGLFMIIRHCIINIIKGFNSLV